jgi:hypothetical protein
MEAQALLCSIGCRVGSTEDGRGSTISGDLAKQQHGCIWKAEAHMHQRMWVPVAVLGNPPYRLGFPLVDINPARARDICS